MVSQTQLTRPISVRNAHPALADKQVGLMNRAQSKLNYFCGKFIGAKVFSNSVMQQCF